MMLWYSKNWFLIPSCIRFVFLGLFIPITILAQNTAVSTSDYDNTTSAVVIRSSGNDLFASEDVLKFTLLTDYKELLRDRGEDREYHKASLLYKNEAGQDISIDLKVRVRGKHRRDPKICKFPPLRLNFPKNNVLHTVFAGTDKLKLVTHCIDEKYVIREFLVYKLYNLIAPLSFRVRLCEITYEDINDKRKTDRSYAFLIEDDDSVAQRNNVIVIADEPFIRMDATYDVAMARLALFQYMIGNTDWSVPYRHNIKLMYQASLIKPVPVPYDFDYTGIVMPPYAKPPAEIGITSVRQRIFRGYAFTEAVYDDLVPFFNSHKRAIYQLYQDNNLLDKKYKEKTIDYLDDFYKILNNPKKFERHIVKAGHQNEKQNIIIKGL